MAASRSERPQPAEAERLTSLARADKRVLIESCFSIVDGDTQQSVPFIFRETQDAYWRARSLFDLILKARKMGFSSLIEAEFLADCILEPHINALVVAHREEEANLLFERVGWTLKHLDFDVPISSEAEGHIKFTSTESSFRVITARGKDPGRSRDINRLLLSERAYYPDESFLAAVEGACTVNARRVIETTANGEGTPFHKFWLTTSRGKTAYKKHFFPWWLDARYECEPPPGGLGDLDDTETALIEAYSLSPRKLAWRRRKLREMSNPGLFPQEFPSNDTEAFLSSGRMVFDWLSLARLAKGITKPQWQGRLKNNGQRVDLDPRADGPLTIWSMPREDRRYIVSADVAEGLSDGAYSVADVLDISTWEQVAQWRGHVSPMAFADVLGDLGAYYNWAEVCPEVNNHGLATCSRLADEGYPRLHVRNDERRKQLDTDVGWLTTRQSKVMMVNELGQAIRNLDVKVNSEATIDELRAFVHFENGDMGAQGGSFSDCVMSLAIGVSLLGDMRESPQAQRKRFRQEMGLRPNRFPGANIERKGYGVRPA